MADVYHYISGSALNTMATATGHGGNKHAYITSKGVIYVTYKSPNGGIAFWRSMDNGDTWIYNGEVCVGTVTCAAEYSIFCDEKDNVHVAYAEWAGASSDGRTDKTTIKYFHGVHNADHSGHYWSAGVVLSGYDYYHCPDVVAHEHNGQIRAHIMFNYNWAGNNRHITVYARVLTNSGDSVNHTLEQAATFVHDVNGAQTYPGKVSVELRHNGDGKTPQLVNGVRTPDIIYTFTSSNVLHYGRIRWDGGNSWVSSELFNDTYWGNVPSDPSYTYYGGLYEHHRWFKTLYSPRDNKCIGVGWSGRPGFAEQALTLYEWPIGSSTRDVLTTLGVAWPSVSPSGIVSGSATLDPEGNIFMYGTVTWASAQGMARITRPKGSLTRTFVEHTVIDTAEPTTDGARPIILPYPQGEQHIFPMRSSNALIHWRTSRTCNQIKLGGSLVRKPEFIKRGSRLVPIQERRY